MRLLLVVLAGLLAAPAVGSVPSASPDLLPPAPAPSADLVATDVVLGFQAGVPADAEAWVRALGGEPQLRDDTLGWLSARFADEASAARALALAQARADVRYAELDGIAQLHFVPDDPGYADQWGYPAILAEQAWDITLGSHAVKVAVLDTGVQPNHPDLAANLCGPFASFVPSEPTIQDGHGHGTHVSGTVAAVSDNGLGVAGTSQSCLMEGKVCHSGGGCQWSWVAAGITWAADQGAHIITMSLGGGGGAQVLADAVKYAYQTKGVLVIASAGNSGCLTVPGVGSTIGYPAAYDEVLAVGATREPMGLLIATFSSCGPDLEISAPGQGVYSTHRNSGYATLSGTSMAAPHVAGAAALVKAQNPGISAVELRCLLDLSATPMYLPGRDYWTGWGQLNAFAALTLDAQLTAQGGHAAFEQACVAGAAAIMH